jgi:hypothetical protein
MFQVISLQAILALIAQVTAAQQWEPLVSVVAQQCFSVMELVLLLQRDRQTFMDGPVRCSWLALGREDDLKTGGMVVKG